MDLLQTAGPSDTLAWSHSSSPSILPTKAYLELNQLSRVKIGHWADAHVPLTADLDLCFTGFEGGFLWLLLALGFCLSKHLIYYTLLTDIGQSGCASLDRIPPKQWAIEVDCAV